MDWKPRLIDAAEVPAVIDLSSLVFGVGQRAPKGYAEANQKVVEVDRTFVVDDGDVLAGTAASYSFDMALPGGAAVPMAGVTEVVVLPTHRRQGVLTALMGALLDQAVERGEPLAGLTASEATIYRRYGYGVATRYQSLKVGAKAAPLVPVDVPGRFRFLTEDEAATVLPQVWERGWRRRSGELSRKAEWWPALAVDSEGGRAGASARYLVAHEDGSGAPDGFAIYRYKDTDAGPGYELQLHDLAAADDAVEAALLRYLLDVDLVHHLQWFAAPLDLPLRWQLENSRALTVDRLQDHLWLRVLDVATCLETRTYAGLATSAVIEVVDRRRPEVGGVFRFNGGPDGAACARTGGGPDVVVEVATLGSLLLGDVTWANLRRAGLVDERTSGTADRLDAAFRPDRAPYCGTDF